jgi:aminopeptidase N
MPIIEQQLEVRNDTIRRLTLRQRAAQSLSGSAAWPVRTQVVLAHADGRAERIPVSLTSSEVEVHAATGRPAPAFVFANADDHAYALVLPDGRSVRWLEEHIGEVNDTFLRAMLWGALWDLVRETKLDPARYVSIALRELSRESDEQIVSGVLGRVSRAAIAYLEPARRDSVMPSLERALREGAGDARRPYGLRKPYLDAYIRVASSPGALAHLDALLDSAEAAGAPLRPPTRWAIVTALIERGALTADARLAAESRADSGSEGKRRAFVAGAARPNEATKGEYFARYFGDASLNEDWVTASLDAFNSPRQEHLTRPYLVPALDSLSWIQRNRRIFFLGSWLSAFLDGQSTAAARDAVTQYLQAHPKLPRDLRLKILQNADELERTVAIRAARKR